MKIVNKEHYSELKFKDNYGKVIIRIQKDLSQIALDTENGDCYADIDKEVLIELRNLLDKMITNN